MWESAYIWLNMRLFFANYGDETMVFSVFISTASLLTVKTINDISYIVFKSSHIKSTPLSMPRVQYVPLPPNIHAPT
jgi:hypothetical protein